MCSVRQLLLLRLPPRSDAAAWTRLHETVRSSVSYWVRAVMVGCGLEQLYPAQPAAEAAAAAAAAAPVLPCGTIVPAPALGVVCPLARVFGSLLSRAHVQKEVRPVKPRRVSLMCCIHSVAVVRWPSMKFNHRQPLAVVGLCSCTSGHPSALRSCEQASELQRGNRGSILLLGKNSGRRAQRFAS